MPKLSVTVITKNEAGNLADALASVSWADEIVVVDSGSTDDTVPIATRFTSRVIVREWEGYSAQKNYAAGIASHDWILSLDADERVSPPLTQELRSLLSTDPDAGGYRMPRVSYHLGRWIRSTDWYPDYQLRLYNRQKGRWVGRYVHEGVEIDGPIGRLRSDLLHYPYRDIAHHLETIDRYSTLAARQLRDRGQRSSLVKIAAHPVLAFLRNYIARGGIRDGTAGLIVSTMNSYYVLMKFAKLWELQRQERSRAKPT